MEPGLMPRQKTIWEISNFDWNTKRWRKLTAEFICVEPLRFRSGTPPKKGENGTGMQTKGLEGCSITPKRPQDSSRWFMQTSLSENGTRSASNRSAAKPGFG